MQNRLLLDTWEDVYVICTERAPSDFSNGQDARKQINFFFTNYVAMPRFSLIICILLHI